MAGRLAGRRCSAMTRQLIPLHPIEMSGDGEATGCIPACQQIFALLKDGLNSCDHGLSRYSLVVLRCKTSCGWASTQPARPEAVPGPSARPPTLPTAEYVQGSQIR